MPFLQQNTNRISLFMVNVFVDSFERNDLLCTLSLNRLCLLRQVCGHEPKRQNGNVHHFTAYNCVGCARENERREIETKADSHRLFAHFIFGFFSAMFSLFSLYFSHLFAIKFTMAMAITIKYNQDKPTYIHIDHTVEECGGHGTTRTQEQHDLIEEE